MALRRLASSLALAVLVACCISCNGNGGSDAGGGDSGEFVKLQGAGASFPAPLYTAWFKEFSEKHEDVEVDYQSVGSGAGIKAVIDGTVDFGASDAAMQPDEIAKVDGGVQLIPLTAGSIVLSFNLEGVESLKLSRDAYTGIFLGEVTKWNDPLIADANPGLELPDSDINVVVRADSSGTTYVFTKHLSEISEDFAEKVGTNKAPNWPVGIRSKGNEGVTASIKGTPGSIGYIEYGYAKQTNQPTAALENAAGTFVEPSLESAQAALANAEMPEDLIAWLPDPQGAESYPIVTYTWIICYASYDSEEKVQTLKDLLTYCLTEGQKQSDKLGYIPLPENVVEKAKAALENIKVKGGEAKTAA